MGTKAAMLGMCSDLSNIWQKHSQYIPAIPRAQPQLNFDGMPGILASMAKGNIYLA